VEAGQKSIQKIDNSYCFKNTKAVFSLDKEKTKED
jgi:hypothetical protein